MGSPCNCLGSGQDMERMGFARANPGLWLGQLLVLLGTGLVPLGGFKEHFL